MRLKRKPALTTAPEAPKPAPQKGNRDPEISPDYCETFKGELYAPLPPEIETIDLRTRSPFCQQVSRKILPCRIVFQHGALTLTLPFKGYHKSSYEKKINQLFNIMKELEKDMHVHFAGVVHADEEKPHIKNSPTITPRQKEEEPTNITPLNKKLNPSLKFRPKIKQMGPSKGNKLKLRKKS